MGGPNIEFLGGIRDNYANQLRQFGFGPPYSSEEYPKYKLTHNFRRLRSNSSEEWSDFEHLK